MKNYLYITLLFICVSCTSCFTDSTKNADITVFRYNESAGIASLDPAFSKAQSEIWGCNQLYNGLVQLDDSLHVQPSIAKEWSITDDGIYYTFILRDDVFFHESEVFGENKTRKVIAKDFEYSFNRLLDKKLAAPGAWVFNYVDYFKALNDTTFCISLKKSFPPFLGLLSMQYCSVVPKEAVDFYATDFRKNPVGTGPFYFTAWDEGVNLILRKNENYFEKDIDGSQLPHLDAVMVTFIKDKRAAFFEFSQANLDFLSGIDPSYKDELLTRDGLLSDKYKDEVNLIQQPYLNTEYLGFLVDDAIPNKADAKFIQPATGIDRDKILRVEAKKNPAKNKLIRQAINYGFDRKKMIQFLRNNVGSAGNSGFIPKGMPGFIEGSGYSYNPEKAKALLAKAGYPNGKGLGEIKLSTSSSYLDLCEFIARQLEDIGVTVKVDVNPPATLRDMISKSKLNFFRGSWIADYADAENYLALFYSKNFCPVGPNYTHFKNDEYDRLYEQSQTIQNIEQRIKLYEKMDALLIEEAPVVVLFYDQVLRFTQKNISNIGSNPMNLLNLKQVKKVNRGTAK